MKYSLFLIIYTFLAGTASGQESLDKVLDRYNSHSIPYISVEALVMLQKKDNIIIMDAREKSEFDVSHIPFAINVGFYNFSPKQETIQNIKTDSEIVVYCSIGVRSEKIAEKLKKMGFTNVKNLYGGIFEWKNKGYLLIDSAEVETENVHVYSKQWSKWLHAGNPIYE